MASPGYQGRKTISRDVGRCGVLSKYINRTSKYAWTEVDTIAAATGQTKRNVFKAIKRLENAGYLKKISGHVGVSNRYDLTIRWKSVW
jgi:Helix-turn-helix domain